MKELSTEEKAARYDKAIEKAEKWHNAPNVDKIPTFGNRIIEDIFPELKESEDERIRKNLLGYIKGVNEREVCKETLNEWIAWLEKQAEHANFRNKIQIGDKVTRNRDGVLVNLSQLNRVAKVDERQGEDFPILSNSLNIGKVEQKPADKVESNKKFTPIESALKDLICDVDNSYTIEQVRRFLFEYGYKDKIINAAQEEMQKLADKVEPKFKVGDWVMLDRPVLITKVEDMPYNTHQYWTSDGTWFGDATKAKLWTIQDAKDGDVLCLYYNNRKTFFIFKAIIGEGDYADILVHCCYTGKYQYLEPSFNGECRMHQISDGGYCLPADKEEQDLLFQKIKEAGYEWDDEEKELKKIEQKPTENEELTEFDKAVGVSIGTWNPKTPEQIKSVKAVSKKLLKLAKKQINDEQKLAWSEEDEKEVAVLEAYIRSRDWSDRHIDRALSIVDELVNKVKSLRPQNRWKPSDEQMEALDRAQAELCNTEYNKPICDLIDSLKKLKE